MLPPQIDTPYLIAAFLSAAALLGAIHRRLCSSGSLFAVLYCLPFTVMHEAAHFTAAFLTGGRPSSFSVWPRRSGRGWVLGSVRAVPTLLSAAPTALAPLAWLAVGYGAVLFWHLRPSWAPGYSIILLLYGCAAACMPSWQDLKVALTHPLSLLLWGGAGWLLVRLAPLLRH